MEPAKNVSFRQKIRKIGRVRNPVQVNETMKKMTFRPLPGILLLAFSGVASASAFQLWEQNASGIATSFAGSAAVADNAGTIFFNPAGMTQLPGIQLSVGVAGVGPSFKFSNDGSSGLLGTGGDGGDASDDQAVATTVKPVHKPRSFHSEPGAMVVMPEAGRQFPMRICPGKWRRTGSSGSASRHPSG